MNGIQGALNMEWSVYSSPRSSGYIVIFFILMMCVSISLADPDVDPIDERSIENGILALAGWIVGQFPPITLCLGTNDSVSRACAHYSGENLASWTPSAL